MPAQTLIPKLPTFLAQVVALTFTCSSWAYAVTTTDGSRLVSEQDFFGKIPTVLSVTRLKQAPRDAPAAVTIIDQEMIKASGVRNIPDLFRLVPGFQVGYSNGHSPTVTYHGIADQFSRRMQVLVDGRSVYSPAAGGVYWADLPLALEDIERIEVIRGPNSASHGPNSFLGVFNIITRHASQDPGTFVKVSVGNKGIFDTILRYGSHTQKGDHRLTFGYRQDNGFDGIPDTSRIPFFTYRGDFQLSDRDNLEVYIGGAGGYREEGTETNPTEPGHRRDITSHYQQLRWKHIVNDSQEYSLRIYHNYRSADEQYLTDPLPLGPFGVVQVPIPVDLSGERFDIEFEHLLTPNPNMRIAWGLSARSDRAYSERFFATKDAISNNLYRLFGHTEWRPQPNIVINSGAMIEKNDYTGTDIMPRLAISYHVNSNHTLRASVSKATRSPALIEQAANEQIYFMGTKLRQQLTNIGQLQPERIISRELAYLGKLPKYNLSWDVKLYRDKLKDLINTRRVPFDTGTPFDNNAEIFENSFGAVIKGAEVQFRYRPGPNTLILLNHAIMDIDVTDLDPSTRQFAPFQKAVPNSSTSLLISRQFTRGIGVSATYYRTGSMQWAGDGDAVSAYDRLDMRITKPLKMGGTQGEISFIAQNILGSYVDFRSRNIFDTRYFISLSLKR